MLYDAGHAKQPDASFRPRLLPSPTRQNGLKYQTGIFQHHPSLVFETAVSDESRERLPTDASDKYFNENTSQQAWLGVKLDLANNLFWAGWGRRNLTGMGLRLMQQAEDNDGLSVFLPIYPHPHPQLPIPGQFIIPSSPIFHPLALPAGTPFNFHLAGGN